MRGKISAMCMVLSAWGVATFSPQAEAVGVAGQGSWESTLQARDIDGDGVVDAYYDTALGLTWLADVGAAAGSAQDGGISSADGLMTWQQATDWAASLNVHGVTGWQLPPMSRYGDLTNCSSPSVVGMTCGWNPVTDAGFASPMVHMWYVTLGNKAYFDPSGQPNQPGWGLSNTGPFNGLMPGVFWTNQDYLRYSLPSPDAWVFWTVDGYQGTAGKNSQLRAWAVHWGDVPTVAEPNALMLLLGGACAVAATKRVGRQQVTPRRPAS